MSNRVAFTPLKSLETALDQAIQQRARTLFEQAKARTARGSGHDLEKGVAGNGTALASACLLLAKTESEGASNEDFDVHQRHAMITKPQFKGLIATLQSVLELRSNAKGAFTPTRGSARKRKEPEAGADEDEPVTPSKPSRKRTGPSQEGPSASSRLTTRGSKHSPSKFEPQMGASVKDLLAGSSRKHDVEDPEDPTGLSQASPIKTASARKHTANTSAFQAAVTHGTPTKGSAKKQPTSSQAIQGKETATAVVAKRTEFEEPQRSETEETGVSYETYWGDMLIRWRSKEEVQSRQQKTELWRQKMISRLEAVASSA